MNRRSLLLGLLAAPLASLVPARAFAKHPTLAAPYERYTLGDLLEYRYSSWSRFKGYPHFGFVSSTSDPIRRPVVQLAERDNGQEYLEVISHVVHDEYTVMALPRKDLRLLNPQMAAYLQAMYGPLPLWAFQDGACKYAQHNWRTL